MGQMWGSHLASDQNNWGMGGMMGDYYGNGYGTTPSYLWIIPAVLVIVVASAIIGVAFYLAYPELKYIRGRGSCSPKAGSTLTQTSQITQPPVAQSISKSQSTKTQPLAATQNCEVLLKTMTPEEQKVFNVLVAHKGKYLQKYVVKESGLSRLKTHRIIARFAERGIVTVKEFGNTNEVTVSDWANGYSV